MKTTANYGLKKPEGTDVVNIEDLNYNADIIDQKIKEVDNKASNIMVPVISVNNKTGAVTLTASDLGAETPSAAQAKANTAESSAKAYTDTKIAGVTTQLGEKANTKRLTAIQLQNTKLEAGFYTNSGDGLFQVDETQIFKSGWWHVQIGRHFDNNGHGMQIATPLNNDGESRYYRTSQSTTWGSWRKILDQRDFEQLFNNSNDIKTNSHLSTLLNNSNLPGNKKLDNLTEFSQCIFDTFLASGQKILTEKVIDNLKLGNYCIMFRLKSSNNTGTTDAIKFDIQKNNNGTYSSIKSGTLKLNDFSSTSDYQCFYLGFEYKNGKATNNQLKIVITLLQQSSAYEINLDYIQIIPMTIGLFDFA
ncbi:pyocin knob domain-containing protein [Desnuesiella massiliensis]|uniref:pyocin knob domain-containing protein n=1 Tax=Desnuesiella massiliensis TaxID=1650662 RepID=UPI0006E2DD54|nr:pyocin knob domain-containing protein [Desnuesiella massiliensis]